MFIKGLPNKDMQQYVYLEKPFSLAETINIAVKYEAFENLSQNLRKPKPLVTAVQKQTSTE